jgi:hypothetical protein
LDYQRRGIRAYAFQIAFSALPPALANQARQTAPPFSSLEMKSFTKKTAAKRNHYASISSWIS